MLSLLSHLALALAGISLTLAELPYIPEMAPILFVYLLLIAIAWRVGHRWVLRNWMANLLGLAIAGVAVAWVWWRISEAASWAREIELPGALLPYLGPVLMALTAARLFRPQRRADFWAIQGLGLLQVSLGCVLANETVFGLCLFVYLGVLLCALASFERESQGGVRQGIAARGGWLWFGLRWVLAVVAIAGPIFVLIPRLDLPDWEPLTRFRVEPGQQIAAITGYSEEIDLNRASALSNDYSLAFSVAVADLGDRPRADLPAEPRWRGTVLDHYQEGRWRSDLIRPGAIPAFFPSRRLRDGPHARRLRFEVPRNTGGLFLYEPIHLNETTSALPIRVVARSDWPAAVPFFEAGGTALVAQVPMPVLARYDQVVNFDEPRERFPAFRLSDDYLRRLIRQPDPAIARWTLGLLERLTSNRAEAQELREALSNPGVPGWSLPPRLWEKTARMLSDHLAQSGEFTYSMENRRVQEELDPVLDFLFNIKEGSCERYGAALTLMLRSVKIPARIVKGFRGADAVGDGTYHVLQSHAHVWVEAVVPAADGGRGLDWIVLDPTPSGTAPGFDLGKWLQQQQRTSQGFWRDLVVNYNSRIQAGLWDYFESGQVVQDTLMLLGTLALAGMLFWGLRLLRGRWRKRATSTPVGLYTRLVEVLALLNLRARPEWTPRELANEGASLLAARSATTAFADVPGAIVALYYRHRYGGEAIDAEETLALAARLAELETARLV